MNHVNVTGVYCICCVVVRMCNDVFECSVCVCVCTFTYVHCTYVIYKCMCSYVYSCTHINKHIHSHSEASVQGLGEHSVSQAMS